MLKYFQDGYKSAIMVTIPVVLIAYFNWGLTPQFCYLLLTYLIMQILNGNQLVPILFSGVVNLHPIAIIIAILFFGGFWGIFFAIPLATLVDTVMESWPKFAAVQYAAQSNSVSDSVV